MAQKFVGEIAIYGTSSAAAAIISWAEGPEAQHKTEAIGWAGEHGERPALPGLTTALWTACQALKGKGIKGLVAVHTQCGEQGLMSPCSVEAPPYFGSLKFAAAEPAVVISKEWIEAHNEVMAR